MSTYFPITQETLVDIIYTQIFRYAPSAQAESVLISAIACYGAWAVAVATRKHYAERLVSSGGLLGRTGGWSFLQWRKEQVGRNMETGA